MTTSSHSTCQPDDRRGSKSARSRVALAILLVLGLCLTAAAVYTLRQRQMADGVTIERVLFLPRTPPSNGTAAITVTAQWGQGSASDKFDLSAESPWHSLEALPGVEISRGEAVELVLTVSAGAKAETYSIELDWQEFYDARARSGSIVKEQALSAFDSSGNPLGGMLFLRFRPVLVRVQ